VGTRISGGLISGVGLLYSSGLCAHISRSAVMSTQVVCMGVRCAAFLEVLFYISYCVDCFTVVVVGSSVLGVVAAGGFVGVYPVPHSGCLFALFGVRQ
jgi:hypothetical protein